MTEVPGLGQLLYVGSKDAAGGAADCAAAAVLIAPNWRSAPAGGCFFVGADALRRQGALAIRVTPRGLVVAGARSLNRDRPWTRDPGEGPRPGGGVEAAAR